MEPTEKMRCDICKQEMDVDLTGIYSFKYKMGGHIECMREYIACQKAAVDS